MLAGDRTLSRRRVLKQATVTAIGLAAAGDITAPVSRRVAADDTPLRQLADQKGLTIGASFGGASFALPEAQQAVGREFNLLSTAAGIDWTNVEPQREQFDFSIANRRINFARANGMAIRGAGLIFPSSLPAWVKAGNFSRDELLGIMLNHVRTVVGKYKGVVSEWIIVNEGYNPPYIKNDIFYTTIGQEYIELAFQAAREADPAAILIYNNDLNFTANGIGTAVARRVAGNLKAKGLIDRLGSEMHVDGSNPPDPTDMIATLQGYDLPISITEFDVDLQKVPGSKEERFARQAQIFRDITSAVFTAGVSSSITFWGLPDKYSWLVTLRGEADAAPTLFDDDMSPKPAYFAIRDVLSQWQPASQGGG